MPNFMGEEKKSRAPLYVGLVFILIAAVGSTLAANLTINSRNRIEFGQGFYQVQACQTWIKINADSGSFTPPGGVSDIYLNRVSIDSLDTRACASTSLRLKFYSETSGTEAVPIFTGGDATPVYDLSIGIDAAGSVSLIPRLDANGDPIDDSSGITLNYDLGTYTFTITSPLALMSGLSSLTLESGNLPG